MLYVEGERKPFCWTLEREWADNEVNVSCIPPGSYRLEKSFSPKFKRDLYEVMHVPGRTRILFHGANYQEQLTGCIAPGKSQRGLLADSTDLAVWSSGPTLKRLMDRLDNAEGEIWLEVTEV